MLRQERTQPCDDGALALDVDRTAAFERNALGKHLCRWMGQIDRCVHGDDGITRGAGRGAQPVKAGTLTP